MNRKSLIGILAIMTMVSNAGIYIYAEEPGTTENPTGETEEGIEEEITAEEDKSKENGDIDLPWIEDDEYVSGYYTYTLDSRGAVIEKYSGKEESVVVPEKLGGEPVIVIDSNAFRNNTDIAEVNVPSGVKRIRSGAFDGCTSLNTLTLPVSVTDISNGAFRSCNDLTVYYYGTENQWNSIEIGDNNEALKNAKVIFCNISFEEDPIVLPTEQTKKAAVVSQPEDVKDHLVWSSSNEKIAVVDENGTITAKTYGTAVITATYADNTEISVNFTVKTLFYDVTDSTQSYYKPVYWGADNDVVAGYDGGVYFGPDHECTRAQFVTFLWRLAGRPNGDKAVNFKDIDPSVNYYRAVKWAVSKGIIVGYKDDNTFRPDNEVTRGQVAVMLWRYAGKKTPTLPKTSPFSDIDASNSSYRAVVWGQKAGVIKGYKTGEYAGQFRADDSCLRQHIVTFLYRYARDVEGRDVN